MAVQRLLRSLPALAGNPGAGAETEPRSREERLVDYAGPSVPVTDPRSGETRAAQIFVAVLGCSNYTYAEAPWTQALADWLGSHVRALGYLGGAPAAIVPDNLKSGVTHPHRYEPEINPSYQDFAEHITGWPSCPPASVSPTTGLRSKRGCSWSSAGSWLGCVTAPSSPSGSSTPRCSSRLNQRQFNKLDGSRRSRFIELDRLALRPLPPREYEFGE
jgi:hypothetical protein